MIATPPTRHNSPREGIQVLRGHLVRRLPTEAELATRTPFALTDRDVEIIHAVYAHGFLTADLIQLAFFKPHPERTSHSSAHSSAGAAPDVDLTPSSRAQQRLRQLWLSSYLERVELPVAPTLGGRRPYLYTLGHRGVPLVMRRVDVSAAQVRCRRLGRLDDRSLDHDLQAVRFWANLRVLVRGTRIRSVAWTTERDLRARRVRVRLPRRRYAATFLPDGYFEVTYPDGFVQCGVVEIDTGTLPLARFRKKLQVFEECLEQGAFFDHFGHNTFEVYVLADSPARLGNLRRVARDAVSAQGWPDYYFATFEALAPSRFGEGWWRLDADDRADTYPLLYPQAYENDAGPAPAVAGETGALASPPGGQDEPPRSEGD